ncbi:MAG: arylsulfatase [Oscillospiraceae bacterium]|nr:arylsulfatase [Oscillospiraceae bacterium]
MEKRKPNVVIIYADDLGYGDLGCYGAEDVKTPSVDALARSGLRFTDGYSTSPVCTPARYSLMTGRYPSRREGVHILPGDAKCIIDPGVCTLPMMLRENGYRTGIVGKWHLGLSAGEAPIDWNKPVERTPLDVGFEECFIFPATADRVPCVYFDGRQVVNLDPDDPIEVRYDDPENPFPEVPTGRDNPELLKMKASQGHDCTIVNGVGRIGYMRGGKAALWRDEDLAETFLERAKQYVTDHKEEPFFLFYALHQPHVPRVPNPRFAGSTCLGPRGDVIAEMDWCVGEFMDCLKENGLLEDTIVIFSSDNGPVLDDGYEDGAVDLNHEHKPAGPLRGGKYSRYEGGIRVPFLVSWPSHIVPGVSRAAVSQVDLMASFAAMLGAEVPANDGEDMFAALTGKDGFGREEIYAEGTQGSSVLRQGKWLYIEPGPGIAFNRYTRIETANSRDPQLYNLDYDIGEQENLAYRYPEKIKAMQARLEEIRKGTYR